jgi:FkbM family methyltransferase
VERIGKGCEWNIITDKLKPGSQVLSGGAGNDISFEIELAEVYRCRVALFDPSPTGNSTFSRDGSHSQSINFFSLGLAEKSAEFRFTGPDDPVEGSFKLYAGDSESEEIKFSCVSPLDAMRVADMPRIDLLKIDIEGSEYGFLRALLATEIRPEQIAVEFHHFLKGISFQETFASIMAIKRAGYILVHKQRHDYLFVRKPIRNR